MRIALVSDTHLAAAAPAFDENLGIIRQWVKAHGIEHTIHLGDLSVDGVEAPDQLDHARRQMAGWPGMLHVLPGNHDIGDNPGAHGHRVADAERLARYMQMFGPDRWMIRVAGWTIIGLDAQLCGRNDALERQQQDWLAERVVGLDGPVGLCLHKPLFRAAITDGDGRHRYVPSSARRELMARFAHVDLRFVASGHTHQTRRLHNDGLEHVWVPSTAFTLPDGMQETIGMKEVGLMLLTLDGAAHRFERIIPDGLLQHDLAAHADLYPAHADAIRAAAAAHG